MHLCKYCRQLSSRSPGKWKSFLAAKAAREKSRDTPPGQYLPRLRVGVAPHHISQSNAGPARTGEYVREFLEFASKMTRSSFRRESKIIQSDVKITCFIREPSIFKLDFRLVHCYLEDSWFTVQYSGLRKYNRLIVIARQFYTRITRRSDLSGKGGNDPRGFAIVSKTRAIDHSGTNADCGLLVDQSNGSAWDDDIMLPRNYGIYRAMWAGVPVFQEVYAFFRSHLIFES